MPSSSNQTSSIYRPQRITTTDYAALCAPIAARIIDIVRAKPNCVLGLATGSSPLGVYDLLARSHAETGLDFSQVTCFNLDEYYPMERDSPHSYYEFMRENLFSRINCAHWHVPDGTLRESARVAESCKRYDDAIRDAGGIDLQLLGIGRSGHIGFNEPGSAIDSRTRQVTLDPITREDAAPGFGGLLNVPTQAITMGIGTILESREIILMAHGEAKAPMIAAALDGPITEAVPASLLRHHSAVTFYLDKGAAEGVAG